MKKIVALLLALTLAMSLTACNGKNKRASSGSDLTQKQIEKALAEDSK